MVGYFSSFNAGRYPGESVDRIMFTCYAPNMQPGQCSLVLASEAGAHREALLRLGYLPAREG